MAESEEALRELIREYGIAGDSGISRQLQAYYDLLRKWNARVSLTSSTEWDAVGPFFREGLWAASFYPADAVRHLDIGSGGGFPAILLKIFRPGIRLDLVESRSKKGAFLETAAIALSFSETHVHTMRLREFLKKNELNQSWDCISWKAIKLNREDFRELLGRARASTQFWMFHGLELPVDDPSVVEQYLRLFRSEKVPGRMHWNLSIYLPK